MGNDDIQRRYLRIDGQSAIQGDSGTERGDRKKFVAVQRGSHELIIDIGSCIASEQFHTLKRTVSVTELRENLSSEDYLMLGYGRAILGDHKVAIRNYDAALSMKPSYAQALNNKGVALEMLGRPAEALKACRAAYVADQGFGWAHLNAGRLLLRLGHAGEALLEFMAAAESGVDFDETLAGVARAHLALGETEKARSAVSRLIIRDPANAGALALRAHIATARKTPRWQSGNSR